MWVSSNSGCDGFLLSSSSSSPNRISPVSLPRETRLSATIRNKIALIRHNIIHKFCSVSVGWNNIWMTHDRNSDLWETN
ncbi:hypothetical protein QYF36_025535 [Acer negundo]|nr:hypothetical protein QYF36_025535 [Acer negundo]